MINREIVVDIISQIEKAFLQLQENDNLKQGKGIFEFGEFQIHL